VRGIKGTAAPSQAGFLVSCADRSPRVRHDQRQAQERRIAGSKGLCKLSHPAPLLDPTHRSPPIDPGGGIGRGTPSGSHKRLWHRDFSRPNFKKPLSHGDNRRFQSPPNRLRRRECRFHGTFRTRRVSTWPKRRRKRRRPRPSP